MSYEPLMAGDVMSNVYDEKSFKVRITFGSSVVASYRSKDVTVARNSAGNYTLTFPKTFWEVSHFSHGFIDASGAILFAVIRTNSITTAGTLVIETVTETGTATDPTSGDTLFLEFCLSDNTLNDKFAA